MEESSETVKYFTTTLASAANDTFGDPDFNRASTLRHLSEIGQTIVSVFYFGGIFANLVALWTIQRERRIKLRNAKHYVTLTCLITSDLIALLGMLVQMYVQLYFPPEVSGNHLSCVFRVIWRWFGLSSGCVAIVMAVERYIALTRPFYYQKNITSGKLLKAILILWIIALVLVTLPLFGFGLYYDEQEKCCMRYRFAKKTIDVVYAYLFFGFGCFLCIGISCANLCVTKNLCSTERLCRELYGTRYSRTLTPRLQSALRSNSFHTSTTGEVAFARLMVALSFSFLICWMPQVLSIPLAQFAPNDPRSILFFRIADILMAIHFCIDPIIYVLLHHYFPCLKVTFEFFPRHCCCNMEAKRRQYYNQKYMTSSV